MSEQLNTHHSFLSYYRKGLSTLINQSTSYSNNRATLSLKFIVDEEKNGQITSKEIPEGANPLKLELVGPGDIAGFDPRIISKTDPICFSELRKPVIVNDFEPNFMPSIEFSEPDFPWRYTPLHGSQIDSGEINRLQPWICLIVLQDGEENEKEFVEVIEESTDKNTSRPTKKIKVKKIDGRFPLPNLEEIYAWAHVQITHPEDTSTDNETLNSILKTNPHQAISRIICPRWLKPNKKYHAFVVPTFLSGVFAALGLDTSSVDSDDLAWELSDDEILLPYYFRWEFSTGDRGDFEYLVRLLQPRQIDKRVGMRNMDCSNPGYNLDPVTVSATEPDLSNILGLEGALLTTDSMPTNWPTESPDVFQKQLREILNLSNKQLTDRTAPKDTVINYPEQIVAPPIYGKWHAARREISPNNKRLWLEKLNLDPRYRVAAGLGTLVVKDQQESLMYSAWTQVGDLEKTNELLIKGQLACESSIRYYDRNFVNLSSSNLLYRTSSLFNRITFKEISNGGFQEVTIKKYLQDKKLPLAIFDPAFKRINRKGGPIHRHQTERKPTDDLISRLNSGDIEAAGPVQKPDGTLTTDDAAKEIRPRWLNSFWCKILGKLSKIFLVIAAIVSIIYGYLLNQGLVTYDSTFFVIILIGILILLAAYFQRLSAKCRIAEIISDDNLTSEVINSVPQRPDFHFTEPGSELPTSTPGSTSTSGEDNQQAFAFRQFASLVQNYFNFGKIPEQEEPKSVNLDEIKQIILTAINPEKTIPTRIYTRLGFSSIVISSEKIERIQPYPKFPQPMYEPLRDLSQEYLLPGLEFIPQNTLGLLITNQKFVESYMVGLNHEMSRELIWREYPTDLRGSYFRQFWDVRGTMIPNSVESGLIEKITIDLKDILDTLPENEKIQLIQNELTKRWEEIQKDIKLIHEWKNSDLGKNNTKPFESNTNDETEKTPLFEGSLEPDITFFGFDITVEEAMGSITRADEKPGWFFVIEERISESRFGMDAYLNGNLPNLNTWSDLSWGHAKEANLVNLESGNGYLSATYTPSQPVLQPTNNNNILYGRDSAHMAWITFQKPFRMAVHADDMIPKEAAQLNPKRKLVLLIRGDLLKKYPRTVIYAKKATWLSDNITRWPTDFEKEEEQ